MSTNLPPGKPTASDAWDQFEKRENTLWRNALWLLALLAVAFGASTWQHLESFSLDLRGLPAGIIVLIVLFGAYAWRQREELLQMRTLVRSLQEHNQQPPTSQQLERLFEIVAHSQHGYRELIDSFDDLVFAFGLDGRLHTANRRLAELLNEDPGTLVGSNLAELLSEPTLQAAERALPRFQDRRYWNGVLKIRVRKTGVVRYFDLVLQAIVRDQRVVGVSAMARDVTHLRETEARFTELFETLQEGIFVRGSDGRLTDVNPAMVRMLGYGTREELLEIPWQQLLAEEGSPPNEGEVWLRRKDGGNVICLATATPLYDSAGKVVRYQGTLVDVTHRREMEDRLHAEQEFARQLVASFPDIITVIDRDGRYTFVSPRFGEVTGAKTASMVGQPYGTMIHADDLPRVHDAVESLMSGRATTAVFEYRGIHRDGTEHTVSSSACPLYDTHGNITGVLASTRDLTERRRLEQQVMQSEKLAAMGRMIAGVAHELNNPLTVILGASDLSGTDATGVDQTTRRHFDLIQAQARRTAEIVQNLLSFSRPPSPDRKPVDMDDLVRRTLQLCDYSLRVNNVTADFLPHEGTRLPCVAGDAAQLIQVLLNLVTNAEQAIREVRDRGTIRIRTYCADGKVSVAIQDDGPGIGRDILPNIFDPFFTTKRPGRGTGLGLSICLSIMREHGGTIEAVPVPGGQGSVFTVTLPETEMQPVVEAPLPPPVAIWPDLHNRAILVVDDESGILDLVRMTLTNRGMLVDCARDAKEAMSVTAVRNFDFILCDMKMLEASGRDLYEQLQQRDGKIAPFILMAGDASDPETRDFVRQFNLPMLRKPFTLSELMAALRAETESMTKAS